MLVDGGVHQALLARGFVDGGEKRGLYLVVVDLHTLHPGQAVPDKFGLVVAELQPRRLLVHRVEAADKGIMAESHMRSFDRKRVILKSRVSFSESSFGHFKVSKCD